MELSAPRFSFIYLNLYITSSIMIKGEQTSCQIGMPSNHIWTLPSAAISHRCQMSRSLRDFRACRRYAINSRRGPRQCSLQEIHKHQCRLSNAPSTWTFSINWKIHSEVFFPSWHVPMSNTYIVVILLLWWPFASNIAQVHRDTPPKGDAQPNALGFRYGRRSSSVEYGLGLRRPGSWNFDSGNSNVIPGGMRNTNFYFRTCCATLL